MSLGNGKGDGTITDQAMGTRATSAAKLLFIDAAGGWTSSSPGTPRYRGASLQIVERPVS